MSRMKISPAVGVVRCLEHEGHGLRDGHEVADDALVRHGHRPTLRDLLLEERDHAAVAPSTLPKRTATKSVSDWRFIICTTISHSRLEAPMMLVGFTALSVEMRTNFFTPKRGRRLRHLVGPLHVVLDGFVWAVLHEGHMLVGRRVEDDLRMVLLHDGVDPVRVPNGADEGHQVELGCFRFSSCWISYALFS